MEKKQVRKGSVGRGTIASPDAGSPVGWGRQGGHGQGRKGSIRENVRGDALASVQVPEVLGGRTPGVAETGKRLMPVLVPEVLLSFALHATDR